MNVIDQQLTRILELAAQGEVKKLKEGFPAVAKQLEKDLEAAAITILRHVVIKGVFSQVTAQSYSRVSTDALYKETFGDVPSISSILSDALEEKLDSLGSVLKS